MAFAGSWPRLSQSRTRLSQSWTRLSPSWTRRRGLGPWSRGLGWPVVDSAGQSWTRVVDLAVYRGLLAPLR